MIGFPIRFAGQSQTFCGILGLLMVFLA